MTAPSDRRRILLIEDDESVRMLLERALSNAYAVESASDGLSALRRLASAPTPDLVICDIMMPGVDGLTVARRMRGDARTRATPIIFLTARSAPRDLIAGIQAGARHYLTKPFKLDELLQKVRKVLGG